eukprot:CAMPEP_0119119800 /NCGR_PEP_ID=MMETSP1310-20130426/1132_1 /TAXON_ID=464262 /ORGANISM="Genus nov. species nov., Strain RCC2339" /LENGTH=145 /DNA_ID=CAMNT_0007109249 /DNA_START=52 /DNA_END=485 /DNA_ORIENTATION=-
MAFVMEAEKGRGGDGHVMTGNSASLFELQSCLQEVVEGRGEEAAALREEEEEGEMRLVQSLDDVDEKLVSEMNEDLARVAQDMAAINEIANDIARELVVHGERLETTEMVVEECDESTKQAVFELGEAIKLQSSMLRKKAMLGGG